jgi:hAT family C-terminal dimerisation region
MDIEVANAADRLLADALAEVSTFNDGSLGSVGFKIHPLHCASLLLHPLTRSLQKLDNRTKVLVCRLGNAMIQKLISQTPTAREYDGKKGDMRSSENTGGAPSAGSVFCGLDRAVEERSSILSEWADFIDDEDTLASEDKYDELIRWRSVPVSKQDRNLLRDVENDTAIFVYWYRHRLSYPQLFETASRLFAIPPSQCHSERCFSSAGISLSSTRSRLTTSHIDEEAYLRLLLMDSLWRCSYELVHY